MSNAYLRFIIDNEKVSSFGCNTSEARRAFQEILNYVSVNQNHKEDFVYPDELNLVYCTPLYMVKKGSKVTVEFIKRGKTKPRVPRASVTFIQPFDTY